MSRYLRDAEIKLKNQQNETCEQKVQKKPLDLFKSNIRGIVELCKDEEQDWPFLIVGPEGVGKSTLAMWACHVISEYSKISFKLDDSYISSFDDRDSKGRPLKNSMIGFIDRYKDTPYMPLLYDEAVTVLFSDDHATKESKLAKKSFILKRDMCHFDVLVAPSFYHIVKDIRERRVKTMLYCFRKKDPVSKRYVHKFAWFSSKEIANLSALQKGRELFNEPDELMRRIKPKFIEEYPKMPDSMREEYLLFKRSFRNDFFSEIVGGMKTPAEILVDDIDSYKNDFMAALNLVGQENSTEMIAE